MSPSQESDHVLFIQSHILYDWHRTVGKGASLERAAPGRVCMAATAKYFNASEPHLVMAVRIGHMCVCSTTILSMLDQWLRRDENRTILKQSCCRVTCCKVTSPQFLIVCCASASFVARKYLTRLKIVWLGELRSGSQEAPLKPMIF